MRSTKLHGKIAFMGEPVRYLSRAEFAARIGVAPDTLSRYKLPAPDAVIGTIRGWRVETIDTWHAARPGSGRWRTTAPQGDGTPV